MFCLRNLYLLSIFEISFALREGPKDLTKDFKNIDFLPLKNHTITHFLNFASFGYLADSVG